MAGESKANRKHAPKEGPDVLNQAQEQATAIAQQASDQASHVTEQAKSTISQVTQQASDLAQKTLETVQHQAGELRGATEHYVEETWQRTDEVARTMPPYKTLEDKPRLKRLETVRWAGSFLLALTLWIEFLPYRVARWFTPQVLEKYVSSAEQLLYRSVEPIVNWWGELAYHVLAVADDAVDQLIHYALNFNKENAQHFEVAKEAYLQLVEEWAEKLHHQGLFGARAA